MESDTEGLFRPTYKAEIETGLEVEVIYERIEALPAGEKAQLIRKLIETLTISEMANVLDEISVRLNEIG